VFATNHSRKKSANVKVQKKRQGAKQTHLQRQGAKKRQGAKQTHLQRQGAKKPHAIHHSQGPPPNYGRRHRGPMIPTRGSNVRWGGGMNGGVGRRTKFATTTTR